MPGASGMSTPVDVERLAEQRAAARDSKDFARADALRDEIVALGWTLVDTPQGFTLSHGGEELRSPLRVSDVASRLHDAPVFDVALHWVCDGWLGDIDRAIESFRARAGDSRLQFVVTDTTGEAIEHWRDEDDVEVLWLEPGTGWAAARNAGLGRSLAPIVVALDGSVEPTGDVLGPLVDALADPATGVVGPFGLVTDDLRDFHEAEGAGACDAIEGYLMAFRRELLTDVGGFDEKFKWYRTADIEWSFRIKAAGHTCAVVPVPVVKHEHRAWAAASDQQRASWSKRNFYRFLDRYRDRWDLVEAGAPEPHDHDEDHHDHEHEQPVTLPEGR